MTMPTNQTTIAARLNISFFESAEDIDNSQWIDSIARIQFYSISKEDSHTKNVTWYDSVKCSDMY